MKPVYMQTEIGLIPEDWEIGKLGDHIDIVNGTAFSSKFFGDQGPILLTPGNFSLDGGLKFDDRNTKRYSGPFEPKAVFEPGSLLVVMTDLTPDCNLLGKPAIVGGSEPLLHNQRIGKIVLKSSRLRPDFLYWYFLSDRHSKRMKETATGSTVRHSSNASFYGSWIPLPPQTEQRAIAAALSNADAAIAGLERLIAKKRDLKQAAMQQLLSGQTRMPGFSGEWDVKQIGHFTDCAAGGTPNTSFSEYWGGEVPWMSSGELHLKQVVKIQGRITELGLARSAAKIFPKESVLVGLAGQGKTRGTVAITRIETSTNQSIAAIFPTSQHSSDFLFYVLEAKYEELRELSSGDGGRGGLNLRLIRSVEVPFPSLREQQAIASVLLDLDAELSLLTTQLEKTRMIKQAMMQELLTGRIRLPIREAVDA